MLLHQICFEAERSSPERIAIQSSGQSLNYRQLKEITDRLAKHWLSKGLVKGDRVALWLPNCPEALIGYLACFKAGLIAVALDFRYTGEEASYCLDRAQAAVILTLPEKSAELAKNSPSCLREVLLAGNSNWPDTIASEGAAERLEGADEVDCLSTIFFTSGTTSRPKGVTHTSRRTVHRIEKFIEETGLIRGSLSMVSISLMKPLAFQLLAMAIFYLEGTVVLLPKFSAEGFWKTFLAPPEKDLLALTPNLLASVLDHPMAREAAALKQAIWLIGGDRTPPHLHQLFKERVGGELVELCGMTETGPYAMNPPAGQKRIGSVGVPPIGVAMRIIDREGNDVIPGEIGEIVVRTPDTMVGYWNDTLATYEVLRDGWMRTGDLGRCDMEGYLWLEGRIKEMLVRDGSNIAPAEVETVALMEAGIRGAAAVGVPDPPHGQAIHLFIVADSTACERITPLLWESLRGKLRELAVPTQIHFISEFPRNAAGKVDRESLKRQALTKK